MDSRNKGKESKNMNNSDGINKLQKTLAEGFSALNKNLTDCAKSLRILSKNSEVSNNYWRNAVGPYAELPGEEYDWVLVKIRDLNNIYASPYKTPHIAEYRSDGFWWSQERDLQYGTEELPFEVIGWKPISELEKESTYIIDKSGNIIGYWL